MELWLTLLVSIGLLFGLMVIAVPISICLGISGAVGLFMLRGFDTLSAIVRQRPFDYLGNFSLVAVPLFILMGTLAYHAGLSSDAYRAGRQWVGHLPGGLLSATVVGCGFFAACSGSSLATAGTIGRFALDEMKQRGYNMKFAAATVASAGGLGIMIPPSIPLVIYSLLVSQSIGRQLIAGFLPGLLIIVVSLIAITLFAVWRPHLAPASEKIPFKERMGGILSLWRIAILFLLVLGGIYSGKFTPTEAAAAGAIGAFILLIIRKRNSWPALRSALLDTASTTAMIFFMLVGSLLFAAFLSLAGIPRMFAGWVIGLSMPPMVIMALILLLYVPLGMFLDSMAMMILTLPVVYPAVIALGFDGIWFGVVLVVMIEMGLITPPVGMTVYVVSALAPDIPVEQIFKYSFFYVFLDFVIVGILLFFPQIALFLPDAMMK